MKCVPYVIQLKVELVEQSLLRVKQAMGRQEVAIKIKFHLIHFFQLKIIFINYFNNYYFILPARGTILA